MVVDPSIELAEPGSGNARDNRHTDPMLQTEANAALERWLHDHPQIEGELKDTVALTFTSRSSKRGRGKPSGCCGPLSSATPPCRRGTT